MKPITACPEVFLRASQAMRSTRSSSSAKIKPEGLRSFSHKLIIECSVSKNIVHFAAFSTELIWHD